MLSHSQCKNNDYIISNRDYSHDYSNIKSGKLDMTLSGKFLASYKDLKLDVEKLDTYPSHVDIEVLEKMIKKKDQTELNIILGTGANGILQNLIKVFFANKIGNLVTPFYSFGQAEYAVTSYKSVTKRVYTTNYEVDLDKMYNAIDNETRMVYICNPNNPTGKYIDASKILEFTRKIKIPVVIDESSIEFCKKESLLKQKNIPNNLIVIKSFSKAYGLANLRIGYLACSDEYKDKYLLNTTTNEFSGLSCSATIDILKNYTNVFKDNVRMILSEKKFLIKELNKLGIECLESFSNTLMTKTTFSDEFFRELKEKSVSVVPVTDEKGGKHFRIAVQKPDTNKKFIDIIKDILKED